MRTADRAAGILFLFTVLQDHKTYRQNRRGHGRNIQLDFMKKTSGGHAQELCTEKRDKQFCTATGKMRRGSGQCMNGSCYRPMLARFAHVIHLMQENGAGEGDRTLDFHLGKVALYR